jgi:hypothetical protein
MLRDRASRTAAVVPELVVPRTAPAVAFPRGRVFFVVGDDAIGEVRRAADVGDVLIFASDPEKLWPAMKPDSNNRRDTTLGVTD